ncbi:MAG: serine hydrolase [Roseivirga sp.]|jgi:CubicO group peptidase (beta-lactamase class C family)|uniref:serine hydrolase domain-containing protein n=1 Tax=Roseivirga sp. TaxID=1964215 RepID=UPI001B1C3E2F|nr:serine hydrolase [Roseivirga sp.]MBO6494544.1 serine hydrolase [Roseivirga sp.]
MLKKPFLFIFALTLLTLSSCHFGRMIRYGTEDITDHKIFPKTEIQSPPEKHPYKIKDEKALFDDYTVPQTDQTLEDFLLETKTTAFLIIRNDSILYEQYFRDYEPSDVSNIFSVSKSVTSLLMGIAIDQGYINSVNDKVTKYLPELAEKNSDFNQLTILDLLNMRSGLDFSESYKSPFSEVARLYYGKDQLKQIQKLKFSSSPGEVHEYQSVSTSILGMVIEKATGKALGKYLETTVWQPMGMEFDASWSVDDKKNQSTKAFCCLNTTARDLAKIGSLYLKNGNWNGKQIVSEKWVSSTVTPNLDNDCYQYQWYNTERKGYKYQGEYLKDSLAVVALAENLGLKTYEPVYEYVPSEEKDLWGLHYCSNYYYGLGVNGQYLLVDPSKDLVFVRLGEKFDANYLMLINSLRSYL